MGHDPQPRDNESARLDSWKEIASFLHRDARTVRRWERERRLPVHRVPGGERSGVFAYVAELERWLHAAVPVTDVSAEKPASAHDQASVLGDSRNVSVSSDPFRKELTSLPLEHASVIQDSALSSSRAQVRVEPTFVADSQQLERFDTPAARSPAFATPSRLGAVSTFIDLFRPRAYQVSALLVLLSAALGISEAVVHYRDSKPPKAIAHQPHPEAQELYLRGRYYWNLRTEEGLNSAVDLFTQSIVNDPNYAAAYAGLADCYLLLRQYGHMPNSEAFPRALSAATQAIALDGSSPEAHRSLAFVLRFWNWDMAAAEQEYRRAIALNPNDSQSHHWYATALLASGRTQEALAEIDMARSLEPQSVSVLADRGLIISLIDTQAGIAALKQVEQAEPNFVSNHRYLAGAHLQLGQYTEFIDESLQVAQLSHDPVGLNILTRAQKVLSAQGPKPMLRELAVSWAPLAERNTFPAYDVARFYSLAGDAEGATRYLRLSCERRDPGFLGVEREAAFTPLRSSPEYITLISHRDAAVGASREPIARLETPSISR